MPRTSTLFAHPLCSWSLTSFPLACAFVRSSILDMAPSRLVVETLLLTPLFYTDARGCVLSSELLLHRKPVDSSHLYRQFTFNNGVS